MQNCNVEIYFVCTNTKSIEPATVNTKTVKLCFNLFTIFPYEISEMKLKMAVEEDNVASQNVSASAAKY